MAIEAIRRLPKGVVFKEYKHDSELEEFPGGIPVRAKLMVDPEEAYITIDLTDNIDNIPMGINLTEASTLAACMIGVFNVLNEVDPAIPRCSGSFRRVKVIMREGSAVGKPRFPAATSSGTTGLCQVLASLIQGAFTDLGGHLGIAFGSIGNAPSLGVISGHDFRRDNKPFVNQIIIAYFSGPAMHGHDGWLTFGSTSGGGALQQSSVEILDLQYPILIEQVGIGCDSGGAGEFDGAPGGDFTFRPRGSSLRYTCNSAAHDFPPLGVAGP